MSRIRTIKPEFWSSQQVVECSTTARLLFVGLWNFADDGGNIPFYPKQIKMQIFPGDPFTTENIQSWLHELHDNGLLIIYNSNDCNYIHITGWHHQKIEKPSFRYPKFDDHSTTIRRPFDDGPPAEGKGVYVDNKKEESNKEERNNEKVNKGLESPLQEACIRTEWYSEFKNYNPRAKYPSEVQNEKFVKIWDSWCEHHEEKQCDGKNGYTWNMQKSQIIKLLELTNNDIDKFVNYLMYAMMNGWKIINNRIDELEKTEIEIPKWKTDYEFYIKQTRSEFDRLAKDEEFNKLITDLYPGIDVYKSMIQAFSAYWGTPKGWERKKLSEQGEIDWRATLIGTIEFNIVKK